MSTTSLVSRVMPVWEPQTDWLAQAVEAARDAGVAAAADTCL